MGKVNEKVLFWASFFTLIAAGMGFSIRGDILNDWGRQFGFTQTDLGIITGQGLAGFGIAIIFFSFFADLVGYGKLMVVAFLLHVLSVVLTLAAPMAYQQYGKDGAFYCLYLGAWSFSLANGTCEAVINPLTASLFPMNKTHWLNILHAGWPGGLVLGALVSLLLNQIPGGISW
jgi:MFS family permease